MSEVLTFSAAEVAPDRRAVLENQGVPAGEALPDSIEALYTQAVELLAELAAPAGILAEISRSDFQRVYRGEGFNEFQTPVGDIFRKADDLALFAVTVGHEVSARIGGLVASNDPALAAMLDSAASAAADQAAQAVEDRFREMLRDGGRSTPGTAILRYSPGYCGWHVTGQGRLFDYLEPERIGIRLRETYLMEPLKSVSGVLIAGLREIHEFPMRYPSCTQCDTRGCRERIRALAAE